MAIDQACIDLVMQSDDPGEAPHGQVNSRNGIHTIRGHAAELGFGSRTYDDLTEL